jgi:hypothetical protein
MATLNSDGIACPPVIQEVCCQSCKSGGSGNDTSNCQQNEMKCVLPLETMFQSSQTGSCCPALQMPLSPSKFTDPSTMAACAACAKTDFATNYGVCACCVPPLLQRFTPGVVVPESFMVAVFGHCSNISKF